MGPPRVYPYASVNGHTAFWGRTSTPVVKLAQEDPNPHFIEPAPSALALGGNTCPADRGDRTTVGTGHRSVHLRTGGGRWGTLSPLAALPLGDIESPGGPSHGRPSRQLAGVCRDGPLSMRLPLAPRNTPGQQLGASAPTRGRGVTANSLG